MLSSPVATDKKLVLVVDLKVTPLDSKMTRGRSQCLQGALPNVTVV